MGLQGIDLMNGIAFSLFPPRFVRDQVLRSPSRSRIGTIPSVRGQAEASDVDGIDCLSEPWRVKRRFQWLVLAFLR